MLKANGSLDEAELARLAEYADLIECECPAHLMEILKNVREFDAYTSQCIVKYPADASTHRWLQSAARNIDSLLSNTIVQLARMEGFIDDENHFVPRATVAQRKA